MLDELVLGELESALFIVIIFRITIVYSFLFNFIDKFLEVAIGRLLRVLIRSIVV